MSGDTPPAETSKVGEALVAALGFEPTDGAPAAPTEETNGAAVSVFTTTADVLDSASPPKGTVLGTDPAEIGIDDPTGEAPRIDEPPPNAVVGANGASSDIEVPIDDDPGLLDGLDSALGDLDGAVDGPTVVAETGAGETIRIPPPGDLFDLDSSGVKPLEAPPSASTPPPPGPEAKLLDQVDGFRSDDGTMVAPSPGADVAADVADLSAGSIPDPGLDAADIPAASAGSVLDAVMPSSPPVAELAPSPQQIPVPGGPLTVDEALGGAPAAGVTVAARQGGLEQQSIGDRVSGAASRLPQLLEEGLRQRPRRVRARKVRRVVRHVDPWSMLTFSVLFHLCLFAALLLASVLVWNAAVAAGTIENIEDFIRDLGDYKTYEIKGDVVFRAAMVIAGILTLASSLLVVLLTVIFNLISDLVGGIRITVIEEETVRVRRRSNQ